MTSLFFRIQFVALFIFLVLSLVACGGANFTPVQSANDSQTIHDGEFIPNQGSGETLSHGLRYTQPETNEKLSKLDILFVIDTSGSISSSQLDAMVDGIDQFIEELPDTGSYRLALTLAHARAPEQGGRSGSLYQARQEKLVLDADVDSREEIRKAMRQKLDRGSGVMDYASDGGEAGMISLLNAISGDNLARAQDAGFFRQEAGLAVVFLADENDICSRYLSPNPFEDDGFFVRDPNRDEIPAYRKYCMEGGETVITHKSTVKKVDAFKEGSPTIYSGIIYTKNSNQEKMNGENERGWGYEQLIEYGKGLIVDLSFGELISEGLRQIGELSRSTISSLKTSFEFPHTGVIAESIAVTVDGDSVPYLYLEELNVIVVPNAGGGGSVVHISYDYID